MVVILLAAVLQQEQTAVHAEQKEYAQALAKLQEAQRLLASDPRESVRLAGEVLSNPAIRKVECRLRIEVRKGDVRDAVDFFPYQLRAKAGLALARSQPSEAEALLRGAIADLERSVAAGVNSSDPLLTAAKADLANRAAPAVPREDPLESARSRWKSLMAERRFVAARAALDALPEGERKAKRAETEDACRERLEERAVDLRRKLAGLRTLRDLRDLDAAELEAMFASPPLEELAVAHPAWEWARGALPVLREARAGKASPRALVTMARQAAALDPPGESRWFRFSEALAWETVRDAVRGASERSRDLPRREREALRAEAEEASKPWAALAAELRPRHPFLEAHDREIAGHLASFPSDLPELETGDVADGLDAPDPRAALRKEEERLRGLETGKVLSIEARRRLYTAIAEAAILRGLLEGGSEADVARGLAELAPRLRAVGGPAEPGRLGPRVAAVFNRLR